MSRDKNNKINNNPTKDFCWKLLKYYKVVILTRDKIDNKK